MKAIPTSLPGVLILEPKVFKDDRGFFLESYQEKIFAEVTGISPVFVQDNHSFSVKDVLRGLHYQMINPQGKLIRVVRGEIFDVAVDIRKSSPFFGKWVGVHLSEANHQMLWIPPGFAHGFLALSDQADVLYKTTSFYDYPSDRSLLWSDLDLAIQWPLQGRNPLLSAKDAIAKTLKEAEVFA